MIPTIHRRTKGAEKVPWRRQLSRMAMVDNAGLSASNAFSFSGSSDSVGDVCGSGDRPCRSAERDDLGVRRRVCESPSAALRSCPRWRT
jgi:hypothetical protein